MYIFDYAEITSHPLHQIEYSITDVCNRNCKSCSHFAPLAKQSNAISVSEFVKYTELLHDIVPDVHTFWLIGGEPTLHPQYIELLKELRRIYSDIPIGIMSNGYGALKEKDNKDFWNFIKSNEIVWRITTYDVEANIYRELFAKYGCSDLLSLDVNNVFTHLAVLTEKEQTVSQDKYERCGWERLNIFVRNGRIWKCPTVEYIDLFNEYFHKNFQLSSDDYLELNDNLTREKLLEYKNKPSAFCRNCDLSKRFKQFFNASLSNKNISEWMVD